ncbi:hypothetical protein SAMN05443144_11380 [Fodinibius roseus]|uniref:Uncharacterized protein n=1 Tax=Fodinibius roseus TaxID=1194090 RepID=A0A1M5EK63_9BACT|nr:hypothetical protein [Fodinibius roseus]SHF79442.1 hypothetical protein SAMN05443144_11380 [Fodinibius roseus]
MNEPSAVRSVQRPLTVEKPKGLAEVQTGDVHPGCEYGRRFRTSWRK